MKSCRIKNYLKTGVKLKFIWKLKSWKLNIEIEVLKIGILKNYLKMEVLKIRNLEMEVLKIKF